MTAAQPNAARAWLDLPRVERLGFVTLALARSARHLPALLHPRPGDTGSLGQTALALLVSGLVLTGDGPGRRWVPAFTGRAAERWRDLLAIPTARAGWIGAQAVLLIAVLAPLLAPYDPVTIDVGPHLAAPSPGFLFGTDSFGRDALSRCLYGARISLLVGVLSVGLASALGVLIGAGAGYLRGPVDRAAMALTDLLLAIPRLILLIATVGVLRPVGDERLVVLVVLLGLTGWMGVARVTRATVLSVAEREFVLAARATGLSPREVLTGHILPSCVSPAIVLSCLAVGNAMLTEAALSWLGLGVSPPTATWGSLVNEGRDALAAAPWLVLAPGALIALAVVSFNLLGDGLREVLDPRADRG